MSSEVESTKGEDEDISCGLLLRDIEEISKALYLHKSPHKAFTSSGNHPPNVITKTGISPSNSNVIIQDLSHKDKKSSIWNWKPFKALTHTRNHRFNCCFFLHVHAIEGLPPNFDDINLCVTWKRKADMLKTRPAGVCLGMAEFEETLMHQCIIHCSRTGPHSLAKYEPMVFLLRASVMGAPVLDIGNHWIDLSRLLPLTLEELERDKRSSGKWTTSFKLTGKAKGAMLNVSFGFSILDGNPFEPGYFLKLPDIVTGGGMNHYADFDSSSRSKGPCRHSESADVKFLEEIFPNQGSGLSHSVTLLYPKLDEGKISIMKEFDLYHEHSESLKPKSDDFDDMEFDVIEQGVEVSLKDQMKIEKRGSQRYDSSVIETIDVAEIFQGDETAFEEYVEWNSKLDTNNNDEHRDNSSCIIGPAFEELDSALYGALTSKPVELGSILEISKYYEQENYLKSNKAKKLMKSLSLDHVAEIIENDFLNMLSIHQSPRGDSLRRFEDDALAWENPILDTSRKAGFQDDFDLPLAMRAVERNHGSVNKTLRSKRSAKMLENLETEALMHEWGLNEAAFQDAPRATSGGFGSPVFLPAEEPLKLPSIEEGVGSIVWTKNGGFLRSMNPLLFRNANNGARLIVQVSGPVVLPAKMGFTIIEVLQCWASEGVEKTCIQANELMPLEDVTGKTMQQVLSEAESRSNAFKRWALQQESEPIQSDYVSFEDLVPMAITNIEGLLVEGLKIQSGMPDQEAPSSIKTQLPELPRKFSSEQASGLQVLDNDELIKQALSLEEWLRLDSAEFCVQDDTDENILKHFAAHCGAFGNNCIMALKLQLRDPLRNYEMVGSPMLALVQVERVYSAPQPKEDCLDEHMILERIDFEQNEKKIYEKPMFKISDGHLAGLNILRGNKQLWGTSRQQQSGSRWLFSSGMARPNKNLVSDSTAIIKSSSRLTRKDWAGDVLWSISVPIQGEAATWDEQVALSVHVRNPDIIFPK